MTRKNLAHARWHYHRALTLFTSLELFRSSHGEDSADELLEWLECMAQARAAEDRSMRAWWLTMAGRHRRNIADQDWNFAKFLSDWANSYGRF